MNLINAEVCNRVDVCRCKTPSGQVYDISAIGVSIKNKFSTGMKSTSPDGQDDYYFNPCFPFTKTKTGTTDNHCKNVVSCQEHMKDGLFDIGSLAVNQPKFELAQGTIESNLQITYTDAVSV